LEARIELLQQFARDREWHASNEVLREFAEQHAISAAELLRAFVEACSHVAPGSTIPTRTLVPKRTRHRRNPEDNGDIRLILGIVSRHTCITVRDLTGSSRRRSVATARGMAIYLSRSLTDASLQCIGRNLGNRDHSTILNSLRRMNRLVQRDSNIQDTLAFLSRRAKDAISKTC
jgi:chromosomal replication initiator protein